MDDVVILGGLRTPIGKFGGSLALVPAAELGANVIRALVDTSGIPADAIDEVLMGQVLTAGCGQNPARQALMKAGLSEAIPGFTINHVCGSGLTAVLTAAQMIRAGDADLVIAGGQESMSLAPHLLPRSRHGQRLGNWTMIDSMVNDGLWDAFYDYHMGQTAENIAARYEISREAQDEFAVKSHNRAEAAAKAGRFRTQIVPVPLKQKKGPDILFDTDECVRPSATASAIASLKPAFNRDGTVTAANSSPLNDGAAAVILASARWARRLGVKPLAVIRAGAHAGIDPSIMGMAAVPASRLAMSRAGWSVQDLDLIEANEAFATQSLAVAKELDWDMDKVNVNGGAIALGHPIGASGCRVLVTLMHEMIRRDVKKGLATLCIGGGQGVALAIER